MASREDIKKEFDDFARKIAKLESLRQELSSLDARGFEKEVRVIESRLHDVNAIPRIERELEALREKIQRRHSEEEGAKDEHKVLSKRISELQELISKKKNIAGKSQLNKEQVEFVKDIPELEREMKKLHKEFEAHIGKPKTRIDTGVGILVNARFDDFINEIKGELTQKLKEKELSMDQKFEHELKDKEEFLESKYKELVLEYEGRYRKKVRDELNKEVREKFEAELRERLRKEEEKLVEALLRENVRRLMNEKKAIVSKFEKEYKSRSEQFKKFLLEKKSNKLKALESQKSRLSVALRVAREKEERAEKEKAMLEAVLKEEVQRIEKEKAKLREKELSLVRKVSEERNAKLNEFRKTRETHEKEFVRKAGMLKTNMGRKLKEKEFQLNRNFKKALEENKKLLKERIRNVESKEKALVKQKEMSKARIASLRRKTEKEQEKLKREHENIIENLRKELARQRKAIESEKIRNKSLLEKSRGQMRDKMHMAIVEKAKKIEEKAFANEGMRIQEIEASIKQKMQEKLAKAKEEYKKKVRTYGLSAKEESARVKNRMNNEIRKYQLARDRIRGEKEKLKKIFEAVYARERKEIERIKKNAEIMASRQEKIKNAEFKSLLEREKAKMREQYRRHLTEAETKLRSHAQEEIRKKENDIRKELDEEYKRKLDAEMKKNQALLEEKKAEIEKHIMSQAKKLFA